MHVGAKVENEIGRHSVSLRTDGKKHSIEILPRTGGQGSSASGGELLFLALATCYCNDIYREADKKGIRVKAVEVEVEGDFGAPGEPGKNIVYRARVRALASEEEIRQLMQWTDRMAEIQNTLRQGVEVKLAEITPESI